MYASCLDLDSTLGSYAEDYRQKAVKNWDERDSLRWAADTERELGIPFSSCLTLGNFGKVTGRDLRRYKENDFKRLVNNDMYGPLFYKEFRKLVKKEKEETASRKLSEQGGHPHMGMPTNFNDTNNWIVPQMGYDVEVPSTNSGLSYNRSSLSSSNPQYPYFSLDEESLNRQLTSTHFEQDPQIEHGPQDGLFYQGPDPCLPSAHSSSFSVDTELHLSNKRAQAYTHFTQRAMLSGGSVSYGISGDGRHSEDDTTSAAHCSSDQDYLGEGAYGGSNDIFPNFDSLMIDEKTNLDNFDLSELDSILDEEAFSDLDQYVHEDTGSDGYLFADEDTGYFNDQSETSFDPGDHAVKLVDKNKRKKRATQSEGSVQDVLIDSHLRNFLLKKIPNNKRNDRATRGTFLRWENREEGHFRLLKPNEIAAIWGSRNRDKSSPLKYINFAKTIRSNYSTGQLAPVEDKKYVFKFGDEIMEQLRRVESYLTPSDVHL